MWKLLRGIQQFCLNPPLISHRVQPPLPLPPPPPQPPHTDASPIHIFSWPRGNKYFMFAFPSQSEITSLCVYVVQIFSAAPAKFALPPSDSKMLACVILGPGGLIKKSHSCCACVHIFYYLFFYLCQRVSLFLICTLVRRQTECCVCATEISHQSSDL